MTALEVLNVVEEALVKQNQTSKPVAAKTKFTNVKDLDKPYDYSGCLYRYGTLKCAVGHLIPDDMYNSSMEGKTVSELLNYYKILRKYLLPSDLGEHTGIALLTAIQRVHDFEKVEDWTSKLNALRSYVKSLPKIEG